MNDLLRKIENKQAVVSVIGLGYVGLPLAMAFATAGYRVIGIDADEANVQSIISCESYIHDGSSQGLAGWPPGGSTPDGEHVAAAVGTGTRLLATTDYGSLEAADVVVPVVGAVQLKVRQIDS